MIGQQGWLPYAERMPFGQQLTDEFHERIKTWSTIGSNIGDVPDIIIPEQWQIKHLGKVLPRIAQVTGSCLPAGSMVRMANGTEKPIEGVVVGDIVVSHLNKPRKVLGTSRKTTSESMLKFSVRGWSDDLRVTEEHVVPTIETINTRSPKEVVWKRAGDIKEGDYLLTPSGVTSEVAEQIIDVLDYVDAADIDELDRMCKAGVFTHHKGADVSETHRRTTAFIDACRKEGLVGRGLVVPNKSRKSNAIPRFICVNEDFAKFIGFYLAEGSREKSRITFTLSHEEPHFAEEISQLAERIFGLKASVKAQPQHGRTTVRVSGAAVAGLVESLVPGDALSKRVPGIFFSASRSVKKSLVSGWFDGDGYCRVHDRGLRATGITSSHGLCRDIASLSMSCDLPVSSRRRKARGHSKECNEVSFLPTTVREYDSHKMQSVATVPSHQKTQRMTGWGMARRVEKVVDLGCPPDHVFDIEVAVDNSFIANGYSVHNCVGAGGSQAYLDASFFDWLVRDDEEELKPCCPWPTYGVGRFIAFRGRGGPGEGSFGAAQQEAVDHNEFGMLPFDDPRMPQPTIKHGNWWYWTRQDEIGWSWSPRFPVPRDELEADSKQYGVHAITRIKNADEWIQAIAAGKAITLASMFGTRARVEGDVLLGRWNGSWAHQMSSNGYWLKHERHGDLIKINNQWGPNAHGKCPTLSKFDCTGSFWILRKDADRICRTGEVYAHSATGGFEAAEGLWVW